MRFSKTTTFFYLSLAVFLGREAQASISEVTVQVPNIFRGYMGGLCGKFGETATPSPSGYGICDLSSLNSMVTYVDYDGMSHNLNGRQGDFVLTETSGTFITIVRVMTNLLRGTYVDDTAVKVDNNTIVFIPGRAQVNNVVCSDPPFGSNCRSYLKLGVTGSFDPQAGVAQIHSARTSIVVKVQFGVNVSGLVRVTQNGFARNHATGLWVATMTVLNNSGTTIQGPVEVVLNNLPSTVTMVNNTAGFGDSPYITVTGATLTPGGFATVPIEFTNPSYAYINFTPATFSGTL